MNDLKVLAPASNLLEIKQQLNEGADEIYIGYIDNTWQKKYHRLNAAVISPNRRENRAYNFSTWNDIEEAVKVVHSAGKKISFALNSHFYSYDSLKYLKELIKKIEDLYFDYVIIEDPFLIDFFSLSKNNQLKINLSGDTMVLNTYGVKWFHKKGVSRITLPQCVTLSEIRSITKNNPFMDFEVFILNGRCIFNSGTCFCVHGFQHYDGERLPPICSNLANKDNYYQTWFKDRITHTTCGICAIPYFAQIPNISTLKIVGRDISSSNKVSLTQFLKSALSSSSNIYKKLYCETFGNENATCDNNCNCIYHNC